MVNMEEEKIKELIDVLRLPIFKAKFPQTLPEEWAGYEELTALYHGLVQLREFIKNVAEGDLQTPLQFKGFLAGTMKSLQANLRHMTWQTQMIADGDFSQRLDFLGEFSDAFNSMTVQLETSIRTIKEKEAELARINEGLREEMKQRKQAQAALAKSEAYYRSLTETMKDVVWVLDLSLLRLTYTSPSLTPLLGWDIDEFLTLELATIFTKESFASFQQTIDTEEQIFISSGAKHYFSFEAELRCKNGSTIWTEIVAHFDRKKEGNGLYMHSVIRDITERRTLQLELERQATLDELTGLFNRRYFITNANQEIRRSQRYGNPASMMMMDIDHFKNVNDTYGHGTGDIALQQVASTCMKNLRNTDILGRIGGEEFAVFMPETSLENAALVAERLRREIEMMTVLSLEEKTPIPLTISIGVSDFQKGDNLSNLMARTDKFLYRAKESGRNRICTTN